MVVMPIRVSVSECLLCVLVNQVHLIVCVFFLLRCYHPSFDNQFT